MPYEVEYEKSYDPVAGVLTARPIRGHETLPPLTLEVTPEEMASGAISAHHRVRTLDVAHPGITAFVFGKPGEVKIVHHDGEVHTVESHEAALAHERPGEYDMLKSAYAHFKRASEEKAPPDPVAPTVYRLEEPPSAS